MTLKISQNGINIINAAKQTINAFGQGYLPKALFTYSANDSIFSFVNSSTVPNNSTLTSYWDFGDNTTSSRNGNVSHNFIKDSILKSKTVNLKVTSLAGCTDTYSQKVTIPNR